MKFRFGEKERIAFVEVPQAWCEGVCVGTSGFLGKARQGGVSVEERVLDFGWLAISERFSVKLDSWGSLLQCVLGWEGFEGNEDHVRIENRRVYDAIVGNNSPSSVEQVGLSAGAAALIR